MRHLIKIKPTNKAILSNTFILHQAFFISICYCLLLNIRLVVIRKIFKISFRQFYEKRF